jgi:hypothetical protein
MEGRMSTISSVSADLGNRGVAFAPAIAQAAATHGIDPTLLAAVAAQETGGPGSNAGRNIVGDGGHGHGVFQIDDRYHAFADSKAAMNPTSNADYAAGMLRGLLDRYGGNVHQALSAYNAGSPNATGTTTTWNDGQTLGYADSVMRHYQNLSASPAAPGRTSQAASTAASGTLATDALAEAIAERPATLGNVNALRNFQSSYHIRSYRQVADLSNDLAPSN